MSIEAGHLVGHVVLGRPEDREGLEVLKQEVLKTDPEFWELADVLDEIIDGDGGRETRQRMQEEGRFLIGVAARHFVPDEKGIYYGGLLYAEGDDDGYNYGSYTFVKVGTWLSPTRVEHEDSRRKRREELLHSSLKVSGDGFVPVNRFSEIKPFHPSVEYPAGGYILGQRRDTELVRGLELPGRLADALVATVDSYYENPAPEVREALDQQFPSRAV